MSPKEIALSVVIPAFNEEKRIVPTLIEVSTYCFENGISHEIIIVDDGSKDKTIETINTLKLMHTSVISLSRNYGKGKAVKTGVEKSLGDFILIMDADNSTSINELPKLAKWTMESDICIGSRYSSEITQKSQPYFRKVVSLFGRLFTHFFIGLKNIKDTQCGFKLIKKSAAKKLFPLLITDRFGYDIELLLLAQKQNFIIKEIPVKWTHKDGGTIRPFRDAILTLEETLLIKWRHLTSRHTLLQNNLTNPKTHSS